MEIDDTLIQNWLTKLNKWKDMYGTMDGYQLAITERKTELINFLSDLLTVLENMEARQVLLQLPSVPKFLQTLVDNATVQTTENLFLLVMKCVAAVPVSSQGNASSQEIVNKSVKWVKSQFKSVCISNPTSIGAILKISEHLGVQSKQLTVEINKEMVISLVKDINNVSSRTWNSDLREFLPTCPIQGTKLRNISIMCLSILSQPVARPLVEALLCCHIASDVMTSKSGLESTCEIHIHEALSPCFLDAVNNQSKQLYLSMPKDSLFSYESRIAIWMRNEGSFENEMLDLLESVCKEKIFTSRENVRTMLTARDLPKALSENISLFAVGFALLDQVIRKTNGNIHIIKFLGTLLESMNQYQRRKKLNSICHMNYAAIWSTQVSNFVDTLNIGWLDLPKDAFLYYIKIVENAIQKICETQSRRDYYYVWIILQGFPDLAQKCSWAILLGADECVHSCLTILFWYYGGGTKVKDSLKTKCREFVYSLRHLRSEHVTSNEIMSTLNLIPDTEEHHYVQYLMKHLVMTFMFTNPHLRNTNLEDLLLKLSEGMTQFHFIDLLLQWFEETLSVKTHRPADIWPYQSHSFNNASQLINVLGAVYKHFEESSKSEVPQTETVYNLLQRFDILKVLGQETTPS